MVLGEVGEHSSGKLTPRDTPLIQGMGTHFHGRHLRAASHRFSQLRLQAIGESGGMSRGDAVTGPAIHQRAE